MNGWSRQSGLFQLFQLFQFQFVSVFNFCFQFLFSVLKLNILLPLSCHKQKKAAIYRCRNAICLCKATTF